MQEEQEIAEKKLHNLFVDEPVEDAQKRVWTAIPKTNLCIPVKWFDYDSDAEDFIKAVARANNIAVHCFGRTTASRSLCMLLDVVSRNLPLRMKKEEDPPSMTLQDRRIRHWKAIIEQSSIARYLNVRLVRYVTLMLVGASSDFAWQNGIRGRTSDLGGRIEKLRDWFEENDPEDLKAFEFLQPKRMPPQDPTAKGMPCMFLTFALFVYLINKTLPPLAWPQPRHNEKYQNRNSRKRKAEAFLHPSENVRSKRQHQMHLPRPQPAPPAPQRFYDAYRPARRVQGGERGKRTWNKRA